MKFSVVLILFHIFMKCEGVLNCTFTDGSTANTVSCTCGNQECTAATGLICYATIGGGSCRKLDVGAYGYPRPTSGNCVDVGGRGLIGDVASCEAAARSLGLSGIIAEVVTQKYYYPQGCFWRSGILKFNTYSNPEYSNCEGYADYCICIVAPACTHTDGTTNNNAPCLCGTSGCTSGNYCHSAYNQCATTPILECTSTDGSVASDRTCVCGNELCNSANGLICYSTTGGGSCRKNDVGAYGYPRPISGYCVDVDGRGLIGDKASCEAAARSLGLSAASDLSSSRYPPGCIMHSNGNPFFNTLSTSTNACSDNYAVYCICLAAPACTHTDGTTNNNAPCLCGTSGCTSTTGYYCDSTYNQCAAVPVCTSTDGTTDNNAACLCGTTSCTSGSGYYCDSTYNQCATTPILECTSTDGSVASDRTCVCGTSLCTSTTGYYCTSTYNRCIAVPVCTSTDGTTDNNAPCLCGTTSCTSDSGYYCDSTYNRCIAVPVCTHTDGTTDNNAPCLCGTTSCTSGSGADSTGLFCYSPHNVCADYANPRKIGAFTAPKCPQSDGVNTSPCVCGDAYGYPRPTSGNCVDVGGRGLIGDKASCEAAAKSLGFLALRPLTFCSETYYPPGCFMSENAYGIFFNTLSTSTSSCSRYADYCICIVAPACTHTDGTTNNNACVTQKPARVQDRIVAQRRMVSLKMPQVVRVVRWIARLKNIVEPI